MAGEIFGDPVVATALLDRLLHHAVVVQIEGSSYRPRQHAELVPEHIPAKVLIAPPLPAARTQTPLTPAPDHRSPPRGEIDFGTSEESSFGIDTLQRRRHADPGVGLDEELPAQGRRGWPDDVGRNGSCDFHGERRCNQTHASTTDPTAELFRKGRSKTRRHLPPILQHPRNLEAEMMHTLGADRAEPMPLRQNAYVVAAVMGRQLEPALQEA